MTNATRRVSSVCLAGLFVVAVASTAAAQPKPKVDLCHQTGNGLKPLSVNGNALLAHLGHGDVAQPNGPAPGGEGFVLDASCQVVSWDYYVNSVPDPSALDGSNLIVGSGIPATYMGIARNETEEIELAFGIIYRQGPNVPSIDDYADGELHFTVASGPQSVANGSFANNAARAAWNFNYSIATGINGGSTDLTSHTFQLLYDVDPGPGTSYRTLTAEPGGVGGSGIQWRDEGTGVVFIADDDGTAKVTQNSENYAFSFFQLFLTSPYGPGNSFAGPAEFDIILQALDGGQIVARNHIVVDVLP